MLRWGALVGLLCTATACAHIAALAATERQLAVGGSTLRVEMGPAPPPISERTTMTWVRRASEMVTGYFGRFSVPALKVELRTGGWGGVGFGQHFGGKRVVVNLGSRASKHELTSDWVLVHEMLHTAFPRLERRHRWMREGLSTYLESVVRAEAGVHTDEQVWARWVKSMPNGVPGRRDPGLDHDGSWGATYWGGALFWLLADIEIRKQSDNKRSLKDALRAILEAGGDGRVRWPTDKVIRLGDGATGTTALGDLYEGMARKRKDVKLRELWADLGVVPVGSKQVRFDDSAPLAAIRRGMYQPTFPITPMP